MDVWSRAGATINLTWGSPHVGVEVKEQLSRAMLADRWERINSQDNADGTAEGIDWTVPRKMLRETIKKPLQHSGLRMLFQGAIRRANHGGDMYCSRCGQSNTFRHVLHDCIRWAEVDIGPDPVWRDMFPQAPECFKVRGLVPKRATQHPQLSQAQLQTSKTGIFTGEFLPADNIYFGTDASGGPRGEDPRLRVVSWAVVAIQWHPEMQMKYTRLGTMSGTLQIGATVNDGESVAQDQLAQWTNQAIQVAVDSKIAIKRMHIPNIEVRMPGLWSTPQEKRSLLQVTWTKGHLSVEQHGQRFGPAQEWAWAANLEADQVCGSRSQRVFSYTQAATTDNIDRATRATCSWLGKRCAHMLAHDPVPRAKDLKFEAVPVAKKKVQKQGLNKRQQLIAATEAVNPATGHQWVITAKAKNLCIKCETCTLFVQQTDPIPLVDFVLQHPCKHRPAVPSPSAKIDPSHDVINLGHLWSCSRCKANYSVRAPAKGRLAKKCQGKETKKDKATNEGVEAAKHGFAALFFKDKPKQGRPEEQEKEELQQATPAPGQKRNNPSIGCEVRGPSDVISDSLLPSKDSSQVDATVLLGNQNQGVDVAPPDQHDAAAEFSVKPLQNSEPLERVGNKARASQPCSSSLPRASDTLPKGFDGVALSSLNSGQGNETGGNKIFPAKQPFRAPQVGSAAATLARAPQPASKANTTSSSVTPGGTSNSAGGKPKTKARKTKDTPSTPSVLQFFRKQD